MEDIGKRKYYKNRWFWLAGVLLTAILILSSPLPTTVDTSATGMISTPQIIKPGTYKVGEDIKAGEYILISDKAVSAKIIKHLWIFNYEVYQTKGFTREAIIIDDAHYLTIETDNCMIYPVASAPKAEIKDGKLNPGVYLVGFDIAAGKYNIYNYSFADIDIIHESTVSVFVTYSYSFSGKAQISFSDGYLVYIKNDPVIVTPYAEAKELPSIDYDKNDSNKVSSSGIKPGEYVLIPDDITKEHYFNNISFESGKEKPMPFNIYSRSYLTLISGQYVEFNYCKVYTLENAPKVEIVDGKLPEGMYKIGVDIPAGTYTMVSRTNTKGRYYIANDSKHLNTEYTDFQGSSNVTVKAGQYLYVENGYVIVK